MHKHTHTNTHSLTSREALKFSSTFVLAISEAEKGSEKGKGIHRGKSHLQNRQKWLQWGKRGPHTCKINPKHRTSGHTFIWFQKHFLIYHPVWKKSGFLWGQHQSNCSLCLPLQERASILVWQGWLVAVGLRINSPSWWPSLKPLRCTCEASAQHKGGPNSVTPTAPKGQRAKRHWEWPMLQVNTQSVYAVYTASSDLCSCFEPTPGLIWLVLAMWRIHGMGHGFSTYCSVYSLACKHKHPQIYNISRATKVCNWNWCDFCTTKHVMHTWGLCFRGVRGLCLCEALKH